jgi:putative transposase
MVTVLREADRTTVAEAVKKYKVNEPPIYAWLKHFGQMYDLVPEKWIS